jgi:3,4-dihydroxy 2-butanone 4-phosphate synthase/GTP cyclohydrolase II
MVAVRGQRAEHPVSRGASVSFELADIDDAVAAISRWKMVVVVDAPDRENEGDLVMAAEHVSPADVNFMATEGRGLICVPMAGERLNELGIAPMVASNSDPKGTAFHVSVDHREMTTTGISAADRAHTIRALADPRSRGTDFTQPGHVFPLACREGGVLKRAGHTEASVDLCRMAGLSGTAVICEIAGADGEMARLPQLLEFAQRHKLLVVASPARDARDPCRLRAHPAGPGHVHRRRIS